MADSLKKIFKVVFWGGVAVALLWLCLRTVDWGEFAQALDQCNWWYVGISMLLGALTMYVKSVRWRMLMLPIDPTTSTLTCFNSYNIGLVANMVIPRIGEVIKLGIVSRRSAVDKDGKRLMSFDKALGTLLIERLWDAVVALFLFALLLVVFRERFGVFWEESFSGILSGTTLWLIVGGLVALVVLFLALSWFMREKGAFWARMWGFVKGIGDGLVSFRKMKGAGVFLLLTLVIWILLWLCVVFVVLALRDVPAFSEFSLIDSFFIMVIGSISTVVPVPGGFGAYHGVVAGALATIWGIPMGTGMILATLSHESQAISQIVCGALSYIHETFIRK